MTQYYPQKKPHILGNDFSRSDRGQILPLFPRHSSLAGCGVHIQLTCRIQLSHSGLTQRLYGHWSTQNITPRVNLVMSHHTGCLEAPSHIRTRWAARCTDEDPLGPSPSGTVGLEMAWRWLGMTAAHYDAMLGWMLQDLTDRMRAVNEGVASQT